MATLTPMQVAAAAYLGGFRGGQIAEAVAVARGESNFNTDAGPNSACNCRGLWQINLDAHKQYRLPDILHPAANARAAHEIYGGDWCGGKTAAGRCKKFEAYGLGNAGASWAAKLEQGKRAKANLDNRVRSIQLRSRGSAGGQLLGPPSYHDACKQILREAGVSDEGGNTEWPGAPDAGDVAAFFQFPQLEGFFKALTQRATWLRIAEVVLGGVVAVVALSKLTGVDLTKAASITPVGRAAGLLKRGTR